VNELLTINEVIKIAKVSRVTIYNWMTSGKLRAYKLGKGVRIKKTDLEKLMKEWKPRKTKAKRRKHGF